jgi:hypothetical protein
MRLSLACKLPLTLAICGVAFLAWNTCMRNMLILPFMVIAAFMGDTGGGAFSFGVIAIPGVGLDLLAAFLILQQLHRRLRAMAQGGSAC